MLLECAFAAASLASVCIGAYGAAFAVQWIFSWLIIGLTHPSEAAE
jgi:hypothetical protein